MSDFVDGAMSLEDDEQPRSSFAPAEVPAETPPPAPAPVQAADDGEPEGTIVNPGGEKLVPLGALAGAREKARQEKEARERIEAEVGQLREKAARLDQIKGEWDAVQPLIQQVRNGTYQPPAPQPKPAGPLSEQDAIEYAKDLDLYKTDGTPDIARAQRLAARQEYIAAKQVQHHIAPMQQQTAQQQSAANLQAVSTWKDTTGATVDPAILKEIWATMPPEMTAQTNIAAVMYRVAIGETMLRGKHKPPTAPPAPAQHTESLGGQPPPQESVTSLDRRFIEASDMSTEKFTKTAARYKAGATNSLE